MTTAVYLDATIPSFYYEERPGTILQAWREITVAFWEYATGLYGLARSFRYQGKYPESEPHFRRSLQLVEKVEGADSTNVAEVLDNLAELYETQAKYSEAEPLFKRALAIKEQKLGADHPNVAATLSALRAQYLTQQKFNEAVVLQRRVIEIQEKKLAAEHPQLAIARRALAALLEIQGETDEAAKLDAQALEVLRRWPRSGDTAEALRLTKEGNTHFENGDYVRAEALYSSARSVYEQALGPDAANVAQLWDNLSRAIAKQGREKEAAVYTRRAQRIRAK
jgi:tetratricopeptide (TPR) repeat protein